MNILFVSIAWPLAGNRNLYSDLMEEFVVKGHNVYVVSADQSANSKKSELSLENGINVLRVPSKKIRKASYLQKAISLLTLGSILSKSIKKHLWDINFQLIIVPTPPVTLSGLIKRLKNHFNASVYLLLKDIWPQGSVDLGVFKKYGIIWQYLRHHEKSTYRVSDYIGCMSPFNCDYVIKHNKFLSSRVVEVCPNSIRPSKSSIKAPSLDVRKKYGIPLDACVFLFSGNLAKGHGLEFLIQTVKSLQSYSKAFFVVGGSGTHLNLIKSAFEDGKACNIFIYDWLPRDDFEQVLSTSDVGLILLDSKFTIPQFPSRLLSYLNNAMPVLCAVNKTTDIGSIVEKSNCGRTVLHGDMDAFIDAVRFFSDNKDKRQIMGQNSHALLKEKYTVSVAYEIIMEHLVND